MLTLPNAANFPTSPELTWRDVQYLLAYTSNPDILTGNDWVTNGAGLKVSHHFGFGAIDAEAMITRARHWINVPEQHTQTIYSLSSSTYVYTRIFFRKTSISISFVFPHRYIYSSTVRTFVVSESSSNRIISLEHVVITATLNIGGISYYSRFDYDDFYEELYYNDDDIYEWLESPHPRRGDIKIELTSPQGTKSVLLPYRNYDFVNEEGYNHWPFMSVHFWGENPVGTWTLKVTYISGSGYISMSGLSMTLYGTGTVPTSVSSIPATCHSSCARGCSGNGPHLCDSCVHYRLASNLTCVDLCPHNTYSYKKYCYESSTTTTVSSSTSEGQSSTRGSSSTETSTSSSTGSSTTRSTPSSSSTSSTSTAQSTSESTSSTSESTTTSTSSSKSYNIIL